MTDPRRLPPEPDDTEAQHIKDLHDMGLWDEDENEIGLNEENQDWIPF